MNWHQAKATRHWEAEDGNLKVRIQKSKWGNSTTPAWQIYIDGNDHGKELTLSDAKLEAERIINRMNERAGF